jgi:hypothetical protein
VSLLTALVVAASLTSCSTDDGAAADAPPPGTLPADYAGHAPVLNLTEGDLPGMEMIEGGVRVLQGPHFMYAFVGWAVVKGELPPVVCEALNLDGGAKPAPGHEFVVLQSHAKWHIPARLDDSGGGPERVELIAGKTTRPSPTDLSIIEGALVVSVPVGERAALRVTDEGRTQTLDLRTGEREKDAVPGYYPIRRGEFSETPGDGDHFMVRVSGRGASGIPAGKRFVGLHLGELEATLQPWVEGRGWAPSGKLWLVADFGLTASPVPGVNETILWNLKPAGFRLSGPNGATIAADGEPVLTDALSSGAGRLTAAVPESLKSTTLTFTPVGTAKSDLGNVAWSPYQPNPQRATVRLR